MNDSARYRHEEQLATAVSGAIGSGEGAIANAVAPILTAIRDEEAMLFLLLIIAAMEDEIAITDYADDINNILGRDTYPQDRARKLARDIIADRERPWTPERADIVGATETTAAITVGDMLARDIVRSTFRPGAQAPPNVRMIWRTSQDEKVCPICEPFEGTDESKWGSKFPDGPPAHPSCRCALEAKVTESYAVRSHFREAFDEADHPRDDDGRFVSKGSITLAMKDQAKAEKLRAKVTDPKERAKLDKMLGGSGGVASSGGAAVAGKQATSYLSDHQAASGKLSQTPKEKAALEKYVLGGYREINGALRGGKTPKEAKVIDAIIARQKPLDRDVLVLRGVKDASFLQGLKQGDVFTDKGYMSTSPAKKVADHYSKMALVSGSKGVLLKIKVPKGSKGMYFRGHEEFTLPRNSKLKIVSMKGSTIEAEVHQ